VWRVRYETINKFGYADTHSESHHLQKYVSSRIVRRIMAIFLAEHCKVARSVSTGEALTVSDTANNKQIPRNKLK
jgi:hypothetical protein